jgi:hypothetical protein
VGSTAPEESEVELLEPELRFSVIRNGGSRVTIRVGFHLEKRPEVFEVDAPTDEADWVDIRTTREEVLEAAEELRENIKRVTAPVAGDEEWGMQGAPDDQLNLISDEGISPEDFTDEDRKR